MSITIDLNCDCGEGAGHDAELMPLITSANIACGAHAGDDATIRHTVALAVRHGVAIGAHPGYDDRANFGRAEQHLPAAAVADLVAWQVDRMLAACRDAGVEMNHVKPHGALYNQACRDRALADAVARGAARSAPAALVFAPAGSALWEAVAAAGMTPVAEAFADRTYQPDGSLTPRARPDALIHDPDVAAARVVQVLRTGRVPTVGGPPISLRAETVCVHGDGPSAVAFARAIRAALAAAGMALASPRRH